jgi:hypothetical protein
MEVSPAVASFDSSGRLWRFGAVARLARCCRSYADASPTKISSLARAEGILRCSSNDSQRDISSDALPNVHGALTISDRSTG